MVKIAMLGAGSVIFCRQLVVDILYVPELQDSEIWLMDIDSKRLSLVEQLLKKYVKENKFPTLIKDTSNRKKAIEGADYVVVMIQVGGLDAYRLDYEIPMKYGVDQCVGDTLGPGGVFRGLRTFPVLIGIAKEMEQLCSEDAVLMNYSNPMAMNTWAVFLNSKVNIIGLCHGVQYTSKMLADLIGADIEEIDYLCAGINHLAWFLKFNWKCKDAYPLIRQAMRNQDKIDRLGENLRFDMFKYFGYFMTESSGHLSEYIPWYRKRKDLLRKFTRPGLGGKTRAYLTGCEKAFVNYFKTIRNQISGKELFHLGKRSFEYCSMIIEAHQTNRIMRINGNVRNTGLITNLPEGCCVEVPCYVDRLGIHPCYVGALPSHCAGVCRSNITVQELAVKGGVTGNREMIFQSILNDPLTGAVCGIDEVRKMVDELFEVQKKWLPQFKGKTESRWPKCS